MRQIKYVLYYFTVNSNFSVQFATNRWSTQDSAEKIDAWAIRHATELRVKNHNQITYDRHIEITEEQYETFRTLGNLL